MHSVIRQRGADVSLGLTNLLAETYLRQLSAGRFDGLSSAHRLLDLTLVQLQCKETGVVYLILLHKSAARNASLSAADQWP
jgi:hypothetical protein